MEYRDYGLKTKLCTAGQGWLKLASRAVSDIGDTEYHNRLVYGDKVIRIHFI